MERKDAYVKKRLRNLLDIISCYKSQSATAKLDVVNDEQVEDQILLAEALVEALSREKTSRGEYESRFKHGDAVEVDLLGNQKFEGKVTKVSFTLSKVLYDLEVPVRITNPEGVSPRYVLGKTRMHSIDSSFVNPHTYGLNYDPFSILNQIVQEA